MDFLTSLRPAATWPTNVIRPTSETIASKMIGERVVVQLTTLLSSGRQMPVSQLTPARRRSSSTSRCSRFMSSRILRASFSFPAFSMQFAHAIPAAMKPIAAATAAAAVGIARGEPTPDPSSAATAASATPVATAAPHQATYSAVQLIVCSLGFDRSDWLSHASVAIGVVGHRKPIEVVNFQHAGVELLDIAFIAAGIGKRR